jgi:NAD(P)-dependent dehydrogenase (short-subunit alcohol dehydrogenase family)
MRMQDKVVVLIGAGQSPGEGVGNGRAAALLYAREGARVLSIDRDLSAAQATADAVTAQGGVCEAFEADARSEAEMAAAIAQAQARFGRIDVLHYNVGVSLSGGDRNMFEISEEAFDNVMAINLRGYVMAVKHVLPIMRAQRSGAIVAISSVAAWSSTYPNVAYKTSKAGMVAFTEQVARQNAEFGVRANVVLPGLMDTPMAVDTRAREWNRPRTEIAAARDAKVPLRRKMGTGWDTAHACLFLASDEAQFVTGVALPVDGGASLRGGD